MKKYFILALSVLISLNTLADYRSKIIDLLGFGTFVSYLSLKISDRQSRNPFEKNGEFLNSKYSSKHDQCKPRTIFRNGSSESLSLAKRQVSFSHNQKIIMILLCVDRKTSGELSMFEQRNNTASIVNLVQRSINADEWVYSQTSDLKQ